MIGPIPGRRAWPAWLWPEKTTRAPARARRLVVLGAGDMDYSAIRAFLANRAPAAPLLRDEVILPADTADVRYLRRMTDTV